MVLDNNSSAPRPLLCMTEIHFIACLVDQVYEAVGSINRGHLGLHCYWMLITFWLMLLLTYPAESVDRLVQCPVEIGGCM